MPSERYMYICFTSCVQGGKTKWPNQTQRWVILKTYCGKTLVDLTTDSCKMLEQIT